jgi:hypothetical protein
MARTTVELPAEVHRALRVKAALENRTMSEVVVAALNSHLHDFRFKPGMLEGETIAHDQNGKSTVLKED